MSQEHVSDNPENSDNLNHHDQSLSFEEQDRIEFREFCEAQERLRQYPGNASVLEEHCTESSSSEDSFREEDLIQIFSLFLIFLLGIVVRVFLKKTRCSIPYTVVLMVVGLFIGQLARNTCPKLYNYTAIARTKPEIILMTFLPILIFESAFSISVHTFVRSAVQILIVALPGMLISTFLTAIGCMFLFRDYKWTFIDSSLFGSIISATDPVAVVSILRELGASESLSVLIEGESLLNDGVAVLLFEIFKELVEVSGDDHQTIYQMAISVSLKFMQIAVGGPLFGYFMAKISVFCLSKVYNDSTVEISITLSAAYLTYFIGEEVFGVSGIMAVVALGITLSSERTCISPESEKAVHHFWEMLGYLANTLLFVLIGIIIGERALIDLEWVDGFYLIVLYAALNLVRLLMLGILSPLLSRIGYGLEWKNVLIMSWGGLRGAVGLCLALQVYENPHLCDRKELGPKILFQTAGIVFLTLVVNATTVKKLMEFLKMTKVSECRIAEMENVLRILRSTRERAIAASKKDRFVADSDWNIVKDLTNIGNPYSEDLPIVKTLTPHARRRMIAKAIAGIQLTKTRCPKCESERKSNLTLVDYQELAEEARIRILKALKMSFWRQYQQGVIKGLAVQILIGICDRAEDIPFKMIGCRDISKYWAPTGCFSTLVNIHESMTDPPEQQFLPGISPPTLVWLSPNSATNNSNWRVYFYYIASLNWLVYFFYTVVVVSLLSSLAEIVLDIEFMDECRIAKPLLIGINIFIAILFLIELLIKIVVYPLDEYLDHRWHYIELCALALSIGDILVTCFPCDPGHALFKSFGLLKVIRLYPLLKTIGIGRFMAPRIQRFVNNRGIQRIYLGYEIGKGFVTGVEQVFKLLPLMRDESRSLHRLKGSMEREKMDVIRELGKLQRNYPEVAVGAKTRHAIVGVINQMRHTLNELCDDGLLEEGEEGVLVNLLEKKMKKLAHSPSSIKPSSAEESLRNLVWFKSNDKLLDFMLERVKLLTFVPRDVIYSVGDPPKGIYLIVRGLVKIQFNPSEKILMERKRFGVIPNCELLTDLKFVEKSCDIFSSGSVIGEVGFLKNQERAAEATCETFVTAYHFSNELLEEASSSFTNDASSVQPFDSFESRVWASWGLQVATALLKRHPEYDNWSLDRIQGHLDRSIVPVIDAGMIFQIPDFISDVIVIEGYFQNYDSQEIYTAPCLVPHSCNWLFSKKNPITMNRLLMISHEDIDMENLQFPSPSTPKESCSKLIDILGKVEDINRALSYPNKISVDRLDIRQRRLSIAISGARRSMDKNQSVDEEEDAEEIKGQSASIKEKSRRQSIISFGVNTMNRVNSMFP